MATIREHGKKWQCIVKRKGYPTQRQTFELRKDAEKWGRQQERLMDAGQWADTSPLFVTTTADLIIRYKKEVSVDKRGKDVEMIRLAAFAETDFAQYALAALTTEHLNDWKEERLNEVSGSTICRELELLSHVYTVAIEDWKYPLPSNPVSRVRKPRKGKPRDRVLSDEERAALLVACDVCRNAWTKAITIFALETAARRGEILALEWKHVDLNARTALLNVTKTDEPRTVPLSPECHAMLAALPRSLDGRVFPTTVNALKLSFKRTVKRAQLADFSFHDMRHDALTRLGKRFNVLELMSISGHKTAAMLARYVKVDAAQLASRMAA